MFKRYCGTVFSSAPASLALTAAESKQRPDGFTVPVGRPSVRTMSYSMPDKPPAVFDEKSGAVEALGCGAKMLPPRAVNISSMRPPPVGVRPSRGSAPPSSLAPPATFQQFSAANPPPVTITGVAPWAVASPKGNTSVSSQADGKTHSKSRAMGPVSVSLDNSAKHGDRIQDSSLDKTADGFEIMLRYMQLCLPEGGDAKPSCESDWNVQQAAPSPTMLPSLKFHDLVFGNTLGEGAFSTVKYARHITKVHEHSQPI